MLEDFTDEEIDTLYEKYHPMLENLTDEEKEDKIPVVIINVNITVIFLKIPVHFIVKRKISISGISK